MKLRKLVMIAALGTIQSLQTLEARAECGDLWEISQAVPAICIGHYDDLGLEVRQLALTLIARGDWSWSRLDDEQGCVLQFEVDGQYDTRKVHLTRSCSIDEAQEYIACLTSALSNREVSICHLRHVTR